ncbi:hypothetical protein LXA43DRAFT_207910 [Ganoderma leucocontextum]|nr:hypothetical protein LXA43DRAFT_207910 [Ganoderma leucocontextum]
MSRQQRCLSTGQVLAVTGYAGCACFYFVLVQPMLILSIATIIANRCAHLVPEAQTAWFMANDMFAYALDNEGAGVNAHTNGISLRDGVHRRFDSHAFVFYPAGNDIFVAYFVHTRGYTELFHRRPVTIHDNVAVEFLYARCFDAVGKFVIRVVVAGDTIW